MVRLIAWIYMLIFFMGLHGEAQPIKVACVGNSITYGAKLEHPDKSAYPGQLGYMLGAGFKVMNFGVSGSTVLDSMDHSYMETKAYRDALAFNPDIVTIALGVNDTRMPYRSKIDRTFERDYRRLICSFKNLPSRPKILLLLPLTCYLTDSARQQDKLIVQKIIPLIEKIAYEEKLEIIDLHANTQDKGPLFVDQLHPSSIGQLIIAQRLYERLTAKEIKGFDLFKELKGLSHASSFHGYDCQKMKVDGHTCLIVKPRWVAMGKPWVLRARFWDVEPQTDIELLEHGFHIAYCDVSELFGNTKALVCWDHFYRLLHKAGLNQKVVLEGFSRGGVYLYRWAARNPKKVAAVYADAPVLDLKSWPGTKGNGKGDAMSWKIFKTDFGFSTDRQALAFKGNPLDLTEAIARGGYPMLHVVGDGDDIVPVAQNTDIFEQKIKALGGAITVIHKPGVKHHPHSLKDPQPIVDFILSATHQKVNFALVPATGVEYRFRIPHVDWWRNVVDIQQMLDSTGKVNILFLGNSITQGIGKRKLALEYWGEKVFDSLFEGYSYAVAGIRGDKTQNLLWRIQHMDYSKTNPDIVVLTIGVNNILAGYADSDVVRGVRADLEAVHEKMPEAKIVLVGLLPAGAHKNDWLRMHYEAVQDQILKFADDKTVFLSDPYQILIDPISGNQRQGYFMADGIHPLTPGYRAWGMLLRKTFDLILHKKN